MSAKRVFSISLRRKARISALLPKWRYRALVEIYLPPADIHALQRLTRQRKRMESNMAGRKIRISAILDGYLPRVRRSFGEAWSLAFRAFLKDRVNPFLVVREGEKSFHRFLSKSGHRSKEQVQRIFLACENIVSICARPESPSTLGEDFYVGLQDEVARELRLLEAAENESEELARRIEELCRKMHPSDNLQTIPGMGPHTAAVFLASIADVGRFRNQAAFANWGAWSLDKTVLERRNGRAADDEGGSINHAHGSLPSRRNR
jgi:transposase